MQTKNVYKIFIIFLALICVSCGNTDSSNKGAGSAADDTGPVEGGWLIYHLGAEPATLNPITATDAAESTINGGKIYETLIERDDETLELKPLLSESWTISDDKLRYRFKLRENVKWHDGVPFTSADVVFSYKSIMSPKVDAPHLRSYYQEILDVKAIGDYEVEFTYARPYFLALEFCGGMPLVPKHLFEDGDFNKNPYGRKPIGTGPYKFDKWVTGSEVGIVKNEDYWGKKPDLNSIIFKIISDNTVAFQVLKRGDLDLSGLTPIQWERQSNTNVFKDNFNKYKYFSGINST